MNDDAHDSANNRAGARLAGRTVILTGAAGNIGAHVSRVLLREGARVVLAGRNQAKLEAFIDQLADEGFDRDAMCPAIGDCADPEACRAIVAVAIERFGELHVLVNNAGGAGPKQTLENIPLTEAEARASGDGETLFQAAMNLLGGPWNMTRAAMPHLAAGGSIVNVSTIFSRTPYFGRIPYVVPKSGLNALSAGLATELGETSRGIRVNTVFPGPIESERIHGVFAAMDKLQEQPAGTTSRQFKDLMITRRLDSNGEMTYRYPDPDDVAETLLWLSTSESDAFSGHAFEVTNGMQVPAQSRSKLVSWPDNRLVDLRDQVVLVVGGADVSEALEITRRHRDRGASVVLAFRTMETVGRARGRVESLNDANVKLIRLDPLHDETVERAFQFIAERFGRLDGVVMLPKTPNGEHGHSLSLAEDRDIEAFVREEIVAPVAFARALSRSLHRHMTLDEAPAVTFLTNADDGHGNRLNEIKRAAVEALIRVWRLEEEFLVRRGDRRWSCMPNQIVRFDNSEPDNLAFTADWTATLNNRVRKMDPITLWVPKSILRATGKSAMPMSIQRVLPGLHHGKCAVITGASLGIGLQLGRYLAMAGARVLLSARSEGKLLEARDNIVEELRGIGYPRPRERVLALAGIDVGDEDALQQLFEHAIEQFGEVDYLINNAGISGAEEMVVDMTREAWDRTMEANLISNYSLISKFAPRMKARGSGRILNVSSYFGGEKYLAVAYPNRADYAVSKAGQRALAEILSRHLGPQIQINAMAPGPVDGARLRGLGGAPGLFDRRARLILENKRLNQVHRAMLAIMDEAESDELLKQLAVNRIDKLKHWDSAPADLQRLLAQVSEGHPEAGATSWLLSRPLAAKLMERLVIGGVLDRERAKSFLDTLEEPDEEPFFAAEDVDRTAAGIREGIINRLHLHRMPTDEQVALSTVFSLADDSVSGETFHPSGGLKFDRSVSEGEMMLRPGAEDLARLAGQHVVMIGEALADELAKIAEGFFAQRIASLNILTASHSAADALRARIEAPEGVQIAVHAVGEALEDGLDRVLADNGQINTVVCTPFARLPMKPLTGEPGGDWQRVLSREDFASVIEEQLTHHYRVARKASLIPRCQLVLITPDTSRASTREEFALAMFIESSLHAFTATLGVESERLATEPAVNQVQLTRRARAEEPSTDQELIEEMDRLVQAVLLCAVPAPSPRDSRYLARIFRGNALTV
ncbi:MAG: SDR family NAD(P)-dependent oxidoreductase [Gammaproteobacteria bacterium]|nr:SDR family NAD(P)-dependent oxidoreductase [Gammaproteobacteria bacterium]